MKLSFFDYTPTATIYMAWLLWSSVNAQYFDDPSIMFKDPGQEQLYANIYNVPGCQEDLMTCMEYIKPDVICYYDKYYDTLCGIIRQKCQEYGHHEETAMYVDIWLQGSICNYANLTQFPLYQQG